MSGAEMQEQSTYKSVKVVTTSDLIAVLLLSLWHILLKVFIFSIIRKTINCVCVCVCSLFLYSAVNQKKMLSVKNSVLKPAFLTGAIV